MTGHEVSDHVAQKIREARRQRGWNAGELAERSGLTGNIIENIESGRRRNGERTRDVTVDELFAVSEALEVGPLTLLPASNAMQHDQDRRDLEEEIDRAMRDLAADQARLTDLRENESVLRAEQMQLEDRITKSQWLIEQLCTLMDT